jgi:glycosyltransferase involved in cell wall biosynthesis
VKLLFLPIERYDERYSEQWYHLFLQKFKESDTDVVVFDDGIKRTIKDGQFLDAFETIKYKSDQTRNVVQWLQDNPGEDVRIFFMDLWHPGVVAIKYAAAVGKRKVWIKGIAHAGTWDEHDHLNACGLGRKMRGFEDSLFEIVDEVFVGSHFHADLIYKTFEPNAVRVVDFPIILPALPMRDWSSRERLVVWPHRIAPEKQPDVWNKIVERYRSASKDAGATFVIAKNVCKTKDEYYDLLGRARVVVSTALQETFGIAMLEGLNSGAWPVVPNRLSYRELYPRQCRYYSDLDACLMIRRRLDSETGPPSEMMYRPDLTWISNL